MGLSEELADGGPALIEALRYTGTCDIDSATAAQLLREAVQAGLDGRRPCTCTAQTTRLVRYFQRSLIRRSGRTTSVRV